MNYYPHHIGDYLSVTAHLEPMEDLAYRRLIELYYQLEAPLPDDLDVIVRRIRLREHEEAVKQVLGEFFIYQAGSGWLHRRCEAEIAQAQSKRDKAQQSAAKRWETERETGRDATAMPTHSERIANAVPPQSECNAPNPNPNPNPNKTSNTKNTSAVAPPDGVCDSVWSDFVDLRKAKKARLTQTALDGIQAEASKAGWGLEAALRECCTRGWTGFKADWVRGPTPPARASPNDAPAETVYQRSMRQKFEVLTGSKNASKTIDVEVHDVTARQLG